jgi:electron transport complex protein RnfE
VLDGFMMGLGFTLVLVVLGIIREVIGFGTVFRDANVMLGDWASSLTITVLEDYNGLLLAILPPGAFMGLSVLVALKNKLDALTTRRTRQAIGVEVAFSSNRA